MEALNHCSKMFRLWKKKTISKVEESDDDIEAALQRYEKNVEKKLDDVDETIEFEDHIKHAADQLDTLKKEETVEKNYEEVYLTTRSKHHKPKRLSGNDGKKTEVSQASKRTSDKKACVSSKRTSKKVSVKKRCQKRKKAKKKTS